MAGEADLVLPIRPCGRKPPLYCIHPVSGSAYPYVKFGQLLPADQPVYGLEAPGFDTPAAPIASIPALAECYVGTLLRTHGHDPVCLLGWSFGGIVAYEMATRLSSIGVAVPLLVLVDSLLTGTGPLPSQPELIRRFLTDLLRCAGLSNAESAAILDNLPLEEKVEADAVFEMIIEGDSPLAELETSLLSRWFAVFSAHLSALYEHELSGRYDGHVLYIHANDSEPVALHWLEAADKLTMQTIPGDHYTVWQNAGAQVVARIVGRRLDRLPIP